MRNLAIAVAGICLATSSAHADQTAVELQARGEGLAKDGRFTEAIDAFKAADKLEIRASHACLIALAYTRRELWPQAEIWLDTCQKRVSPGDSLPEWGAELEKQIKDRLAAANVAAVEIRVEPAAAAAKITVSSFPPDEIFGPRTIHLPPGHHVLIAKAPGYLDGEHALDLTDKADQHVVITLRPIPSGKVGSTTPDRQRRGGNLILAGFLLGGAGVLTYAWMGYEWNKINDASNSTSSTAATDYTNAPHDAYHLARLATLGLWTGSAVCLAVGLVLRHQSSTEQPMVSAAPIPGGGMVSIGWRR